ncbi:MAG TPA: DUF2231 domain-containing protein [Gemmatimonadaceae bacterium]|nr:DUF2231 domain-containing protein [Gemmatimonadaceae bacterium]
MLSAARIKTHPIHPMLVGFPIACWTLSVAANLYAAYANTPHFFGYYLAAAGCVTALVAAIPGFIDLFGAIPASHPARAIGWRHAVLNLIALALFAVSVAVRPNPSSMTYLAYGTALAGLAVLAVSGWLGGTLVYDHRVGVPEGVESASRATRGGTASP